MQKLLSLGLSIYLTFYVFEGVIRYGFHLVGADSLIFIRDACLIVPLAFMFVQQFANRQVHPAYIIYALVVLLHGLVMFFNIGNVMAIIYGAKMLITILVGALAAPVLFKPTRPLVLLIFAYWAVSCVGVYLDKYLMEMPWMGMETQIGDVQVEISRDWQIEGADKRAGGFMRSSINVATVMPLLALLLMFNLRSVTLRLIVALATIPVLVWTTQKGPIVAYLVMLGFFALNPRHPLFVLRAGVLTTMFLSVAFPLILPGYSMPHADGVFSFSSFYQRVEEMWPDAWRWIDRHEAFPFGVGMGGISGAQRLYAKDEMNAADNIFVLMYGYFGMMSFVYLGAVAVIVMRTRNDASKMACHAMATLVFLFGYGCVISLLEDQMASLFMGASVAWLCHEIRQRQAPPAGNQLVVRV